MAKLRIILGDTGTGKTYSLRNLSPESTVIIQAVDKDLSFTGSRRTYNATSKNIAVANNYAQLIKYLKAIDKKATKVNTIIIDDVGFIMQKEFFARAEETGYTKFGEMGKHMQSILDVANNTKYIDNIFLVFHDDDDTNDRKKVKKKIKLIGQMLEDKYNPLALVDVVLYSYCEFDDDDIAQYGFITNRSKLDKIIIPAKSPAGMFAELKIDNDLDVVIKRINEYYNE